MYDEKTKRWLDECSVKHPTIDKQKQAILDWYECGGVWDTLFDNWWGLRKIKGITSLHMTEMAEVLWKEGYISKHTANSRYPCYCSHMKWREWTAMQPASNNLILTPVTI